MNKNILNKDQLAVLPLLKPFMKDYYLAGGTAIALQIGHRKSIDFDMFSDKKINRSKIDNLLKEQIERVIVSNKEEYTLIIKGVKVTFLHYPFKTEISEKLGNYCRMPGLLDLAAMKAYTIGKRTEIKDYVDLYFLIKGHFQITEVEKRATEIFGTIFSPKLFRSQLIYFDDLDFSQKIDYIGQNTTHDELEGFLIKSVSDSFV